MHKQLDKPQSDAVLSCPMCFTPICYDCQRHETYKTQFRAMFVSNVSVSYGEVLRYGATPTPKKGSQKQKQAQGGDVPTGYRPQDVYHPVRCQTCDCEVGVIDHEEIYHFFNVIAE
ncbi:E2F-associated phosphoprotein [Entophlyctis helioformis]|nr:E2F-associated phosphoprotein [Entophlyctis helioformis]